MLPDHGGWGLFLIALNIQSQATSLWTYYHYRLPGRQALSGKEAALSVRYGMGLRAVKLQQGCLHPGREVLSAPRPRLQGLDCLITTVGVVSVCILYPWCGHLTWERLPYSATYSSSWSCLELFKIASPVGLFVVVVYFLVTFA